MTSNMLSIMFGTRTDSAQDPVVIKAMEIGMEFMDLTGEEPSRLIDNGRFSSLYDRGIVKRR